MNVEWSKTPLTADEAISRIERLPDFLSPIAEAARAIVLLAAWIDDSCGAILAGYRLDMGIIHAHDLIIFPPLSRSQLDTYEKVNDFSLPDKLVEFLVHINGCNILNLQVYGAAASMAQSPPMLDRSRRAPLDISSGRCWRARYSPANENDLLFASKNVGDNGQIGYFMSPTGQIVGRGNGSPMISAQSGPWANVTDWLASEIEQVH
jgi:hypothetical protein